MTCIHHYSIIQIIIRIILKIIHAPTQLFLELARKIPDSEILHLRFPLFPFILNAVPLDGQMCQSIISNEFPLKSCLISTSPLHSMHNQLWPLSYLPLLSPVSPSSTSLHFSLSGVLLHISSVVCILSVSSFQNIKCTKAEIFVLFTAVSPLLISISVFIYRLFIYLCIYSRYPTNIS